MFSPSVPSPLPVLAVTVHCVSGSEVTAVTLVMDAPLTVPVVARAKLLLVRSWMGSAKVTVQETELAFVGEEAARLMDVIVVLGRSTGVQVLVPLPAHA